jgi:hypothetical protein
LLNRSPLSRNRDAMDDDELIARVAGGDDAALRELFFRHAARPRRRADRCSDPGGRSGCGRSGVKDMPPDHVPGAVAAAIERVSLGNKARAKLRTLSGGMLRRVGIAQAIVNEPELLLLDEPTTGLDPEQRAQFRALPRELGQRATVIVSTHLVEDVGAACGEVALMDER